MRGIEATPKRSWRCATRTSWSSSRLNCGGVPPQQYGHAGLLEAFALWPAYWDDFRIEILRTVDLGEQVVVTTDQSGRSKDSGIEVTSRFTFLFTLGDGKITEWRIFLRESEALEAARLPE
jgi:ketosteroid isomerase-like protein